MVSNFVLGSKKISTDGERTPLEVRCGFSPAALLNEHFEQPSSLFTHHC